MSRYLTVLSLTLLLSGCIGSGASRRAEEPVSSRFISNYQSGNVTPRDKALYYFSRAAMLSHDGDLLAVSEALDMAVLADPDTPDLKVFLARVELELERPDIALRYLEDALRDDPDLLSAHRLLGQLLMEQQRAGEAASHFRRVVEHYPDDEVAALELAQAQALDGDVAGGIETLRSFVSRQPEAIRSRYALARLYRQLDLLASAADEYRTVLRLHPIFSPAYAELGNMYEEQGDRENLRKALAVYQEGLARLPNDSSLRHHVARALVRLDRLPEALEQLAHLVDQDPSDHEAWRRKGLIHLELEQWRDAATAFERLLPMARDRGPIHYYLGLALERLEDIPGAVKEFRQVPETSELFGDARLHAAFLFQEMRRQPEAIQMLEPAVRADKASVDATLYLGGLYVEIGDFARALQVYQRAAQTFPGNTKVLFRIGALLERMGMRDQAEKTFYDLLEVDSDHAEALNYLAYLYAEENIRLDEALEMAQRAVALKEEGHILDTLGWVLYRLERYEESRTHLERAHALLPDDPVILEHLGDVYRRLGMQEAAIDAYRRVLQAAPQQGSARDKLQELVP